MHRYSLETAPRELVMSAALPASSMDVLWLPHEPEGQENSEGASNHALPRVQHGAVKSPVWEGQADARTEFPGDGVSPKGAHGCRELDRAYAERCAQDSLYAPAAKCGLVCLRGPALLGVCALLCASLVVLASSYSPCHAACCLLLRSGLGKHRHRAGSQHAQAHWQKPRRARRRSTQPPARTWCTSTASRASTPVRWCRAWARARPSSTAPATSSP